MKDIEDFFEKLKVVGEVPKEATLVRANAVGLYPSIPRDGGLEVLCKQYDKFKNKVVPTEDIIKIADFMLKNNPFELKFCQQVSSTAMN